MLCYFGIVILVIASRAGSPASANVGATFTVNTAIIDPANVGLSNLTLYYSKDGGAWTEYADSTTGTFAFSGTAGVYDFYTVATDSLGMIEGIPDSYDSRTTVSVSSSSDSGGGSGTGSSLVLSEPRDNVFDFEMNSSSLGNGTSAYYPFGFENGVYLIILTGSGDQEDVSMGVEILNGTSKRVPNPPPGVVYMDLNIISSTKDIKEAIVKFKVDNKWLAENGFDASEIKLVKFDGTEWIILETSVTGTDDQWTYFETKVTSFSSFAIVGIRSGQSTQISTPAPTPRAGVTADTTEAPEPKATKKAPGFESVVAIAAITIAMIGAAYLRRKKNL